MILTYKLQRLALDSSLIFFHTATHIEPIGVEATNKLISETPNECEIFKIAGNDTVIELDTDKYLRYVN